MDIDRGFIFSVGVWDEDGACIEHFGEFKASSKEGAINAYLETPGSVIRNDLDATPIHYIGADGLEYDFR